MKAVRGKVIGGKVVLEGEPLEEGATVTVLASEDGNTFEVDEAQRAELAAAIAEADNNDFVDTDAFLRSLRNAPGDASR